MGKNERCDASRRGATDTEMIEFEVLVKDNGFVLTQGERTWRLESLGQIFTERVYMVGSRFRITIEAIPSEDEGGEET